jgi:hypothetical protein
VRDVVTNLVASVLAGTAVWLAQRLLRYRRMARRRAFFGLGNGTECLLAVSRHASSPHQLSVHRRDVAALVELATIARDCGARVDLVAEDDIPKGIGRSTEFCVGGPSGNPRTGAHLRSILRGVQVAQTDTNMLFSIGTAAFRREPDRAEYVVLARAWGPAGGHPVFVLCGQTARTNLAAARFLTASHRELFRRYGATKPFCLVLRIVEPTVYGPDFTEIAADVTDDAFEWPPATGTPTGTPTEQGGTPSG